MVQIVRHGSAEYWATVDLRRRVLRWPLGLDFTEQELKDEAEQVHFAILEADTAIACLIFIRQGDGVKMRQVAVDSSRQGQGLGRELVEFAESWAREQGFKSIHLHSRESAIPFYLALGYLADGEEFEEVGIRHRRMDKTLKANPGFISTS